MADEWCTESSFTVVHTEHRNKAANGVVNGLRDDDDDDDDDSEGGPFGKRENKIRGNHAGGRGRDRPQSVSVSEGL